MRESEQRRQENRRRPEFHPRGQRVLQISAEREFFRESDDSESQSPLHHSGDDCGSVNGETGEMKSAKKKNAEEAAADRKKAS